MTIYTIGHSTFSESDFLTLADKHFTTLIDTRSHPGSRWPQHNREEMEKWVPKAGVGYEWWPELGGWNADLGHSELVAEMLTHGVDIRPYLGRKFPKQRIAAEEAPTAVPSWTNTGLRDYSFFTATHGFLEAADRLIERGRVENVAIMCCECQWWRCHRSMIADYLAYRNVECVHIMPHMRQKNLVKYVSGSKLKPHSLVLDNRLDRYEPYVKTAWRNYSEAHA